MNFEEFQEYFWSYISGNIVSNLDRIENNIDFCENICYDCYRIYTKSNLDIDIICKLAENILYNIKRYKPMLGI